MLWKGGGRGGEGGRGKGSGGGHMRWTEFIFYKESISEVNQNPNIAPTFAFQALDKQQQQQQKMVFNFSSFLTV